MAKTRKKETDSVRQGEHHSTLSLRRTADGLRVVGEAPGVHLLPSSFIMRGLEQGDVEVLVNFAGISYTLCGYEEDAEGNPIPTSWVVERVL